jgi:hypothetical protein
MAIDLLRSCLQSPDQPGGGSSSAVRIVPDGAAGVGHPPNEKTSVKESASAEQAFDKVK